VLIKNEVYKRKITLYLSEIPTVKKVKQSYNTPMEAQGGEVATPRFTLGKEPPIPIVQGAGWAPEPVWTHDRGDIFYLCRGSNEESYYTSTYVLFYQ
jgi:hypothetical protein